MQIKLQTKTRKLLLPLASAAALVLGISLTAFGSSLIPSTRELLVPVRDFASGAKIHQSDLSPVRVQIGDLANSYLSRASGDLILNRSIRKGEFIPKTALSKVGLELMPIRINGLTSVTKSLTVGDRVDVWVTGTTAGEQTAPEPVAFDAIITALEVNSSMTQHTTDVELRVSREYLESLLSALGSNMKIALILHETLADIE